MGSLFVGALWYNESQKVGVLVYACYYGARWPWSDLMAESLFRGESPNDVILNYDYRCYRNTTTNYCDPSTNKTFIGYLETTSRSVNGKLVNISDSVTPSRLLNDSFYGLYQFYSSVRNT
jgi:hypothetical protein